MNDKKWFSYDQDFFLKIPAFYKKDGLGSLSTLLLTFATSNLKVNFAIYLKTCTTMSCRKSRLRLKLCP